MSTQPSTPPVPGPPAGPTTPAVRRTSGSVVASVIGSSRPISWVNTAYPFAAAYLMSGGGITATFVVGTLYFLVPYNLLMYGINDVFDYESDLRNPRKGGVEGIVLDRRMHRTTLWSAVLSNVPFLVFLVVAALAWPTLGGPSSVSPAACLVTLAVSVFAVVAYSAPGLRFKERPVLDSATSRKAAGPRSPCTGCCQRTSASTPVTRPDRRSTCGW